MLSRLLVITLAAATLASAMSPGRDGHGLIGYGIDMYDPVCASACQAAAPMMLTCSDAASFESHDDGMSMMAMPDMSMPTNGNVSATPSPACMAANVPWLQTVAYCINTHCSNATVSTMQREQYWYTNLIGRADDQPQPIMSYTQTLMMLTAPPNMTGSATEALTAAVLVDEATYTSNFNSYGNFQHAEALHSRYSLVVFLTCVALPVALSLLRFVPQWTGSRAYTLLQAHVIEAPLFASAASSDTTRAQALMITYIVLINVILCAVGYRSASPSAWYASSSDEIMAFVANRTGVLSFVNVPLLILFAGRNNVLLYVTNWSRPTFVKLHRWVSVVCTLQACIHSAVYLRIKLKEGVSAYNEEARMPYWILGIVATLALSLLLPLSLVQLRRRAYEVFLIVHIALAVLAIVGCWYHIILRFGHQWGYEVWLYVAMAVWAFERLARVLRIIASGGTHQATLYAIDDDYMRVVVDGINVSGGHVYAYFFSLPSQWPWQNHPFSVIPFGTMTRPKETIEVAVQDDKSSTSAHNEKHEITPCDESGVCAPRRRTVATEAAAVPILAHGQRRNAITLLVRVKDGTTRALQQYADMMDGSDVAPSIPCWIEPGYGVHSPAGGMDGVWCDVGQHARDYPNIVCIAGGVGITALMPLLAQASAWTGTMKLFWGARSAALVRAVEEMMVEHYGQDVWPPADSQLSTSYAVGERMDVMAVLAAELSARQGTQVIVSGPPSMMHDVRVAVVQLIKQQNAKVRLVKESFVF